MRGLERRTAGRGGHLPGFPSDDPAGAFQLRRVQQGLEPNDWKAVPDVGTGVQEIRVHAGKEHRVFYVARFAEGIYVLHAFEKRTWKTAKRDLALARSRYRELLQMKRQGGS